MKHLTSRCINKNTTNKTKFIINNHKLTVFREILKYFYDNTNNLNDILTTAEIDSLNNIIDSFNTNNKHTTLDEFILYEKQFYIFQKILQKEQYLINIIKNICKIEILSESKEIFLDKIFKVLESFNLSNLQKIKNDNLCNLDSYSQNNQDTDDDDDNDNDAYNTTDDQNDIDNTLSSESLSQSLSDTEDDTQSSESLSESLSDTEQENTIINPDLESKIQDQYLFLQNNYVSKLFL
tara:strand:- start:2481 stop:3191 length:711 start_codon:yes stop_codon:yes gene_type:complete